MTTTQSASNNAANKSTSGNARVRFGQNGESYIMVLNRAAKFLRELQANPDYKGKKILLSCHGTLLNASAYFLSEMPEAKL